MSKSAIRYAWTSLPKDVPMPMLERKRIIGDKMMISEVFLHQGCVVASHFHENEQFCCVLDGWLQFEIGAADSTTKEIVDVRSGEVLHLPSNIPHGAKAMVDTRVLDLFSPPSATTGIDQHP